MKQYLYVSQFDLNDFTFNKYLIDHFDDIQAIITNQVSFLDLINSICISYNLDDDVFDVIRKSISNKTHIQNIPMSSVDFSFSIFDYLYHKYADNKLSQCALLRIMYMYDISIIIYDASCFNLLIPSAYLAGKHVVSIDQELMHLKYQLSINTFDLLAYQAADCRDIFFVVLNKYLNLPIDAWKQILVKK